jgi:hypothetical protein
MILILVAIIVASVIAGALMWYSGKNYGAVGALAGVLGFILALIAGLADVAYAFAGWSWFAAEHKAQIINREYDTKYTQVEVFWASDVIETVRQLDRKRIELNGDIMREGKECLIHDKR